MSKYGVCPRCGGTNIEQTEHEMMLFACVSGKNRWACLDCGVRIKEGWFRRFKRAKRQPDLRPVVSLCMKPSTVMKEASDEIQRNTTRSNPR